MLSSVYMSQYLPKQCITALQAVTKDNNLLGFIAADFALDDLLLDSRLTAPEMHWQQFRGDPAVRGTVFMQERVPSLLDQRIDEVLDLMHRLMCDHGVFHSKIHFSSGRCSLWLFNDPYNYRLHRVDEIINPDICNCGGISAMLDIAAMAQPHAVAIAPHNYNSTLVGLAATVQLSAMIPNFMIAECFINLKPACDEIAVTPLTVHEGFVELPATPGIGIDLDIARLGARPYRDMGTRMGKGLRSHTEEFPRKHYAVGATRTGY